MKKFVLFSLATLLPYLGFTQTLKTQSDSVSYSLGVIVGKNLKGQGVSNLNLESFIRAIDQVINNRETDMAPSEAESYYRTYQQSKTLKEGQMNKEIGEKFLAENATKEGIMTTESGLQYEILKMGEGPKPAATDKVLTHYHGTLIDGRVFDSSVDRGEPIAFGLNQVISGWTEVLQLMPVGSKWRAYLPYNLAYGERSAGPLIKPFSALIFEIELLEIQ